MPKRKSDDDYDKLYKKIKKLERKLRRRSLSRNRSNSRSNSTDMQIIEDSQDQEKSNDVEVGELLDAQLAGNFQTNIANSVERLTETSPHSATDKTTETTTTIRPSTDLLQQSTDLIFVDSVAIDIPLDSVMLEILGEDPTIPNTYGPDINKDLAVRLEYITTHGLNKDLRKEINEKYLLPGNCKLINAPALNAEIKAAIPDLTIKRDKNIEIRQKQIANAISCLGQAINVLISKPNNEVDSNLVKMLMDTERILYDSQYCDSVIRRNFILSTLKKDMKDQLQNTKPDTLLFGQNLNETIKIAKAISKSGAELKTAAPKPQVNNKKPSTVPNTSKHLNWKGPYPPRKPPIQMPRTKEPPRNRPRPSTSSRPLQQQQSRGRR